MRASHTNVRQSMSMGMRRNSSGARLSEGARMSQEDNLLDEEHAAVPTHEEVAAAAAAAAAAGVVLLEPRHAPPKEALGPAGAVHVKVTAHVMSLSDIDSREQQFECLLWLQARRECCVARARRKCACEAATSWGPRRVRARAVRRRRPLRRDAARAHARTLPHHATAPACRHTSRARLRSAAGSALTRPPAPASRTHALARSWSGMCACRPTTRRCRRGGRS
jgi:hypothetical protein